MANFKSITELPVTSSSNGVNLIINDNGAAKQIAASAVGAQADWAETNENSPAFIKNKPGSSKELVYEWNPGIDEDGNPITDVGQFMQNIDDDMTWLTNKMDDCDFEFVLTQYGSYEDDSENNVVDSNVETTLMFGSANGGGYLAFHKDMNENIEIFQFELSGGSYTNSNRINYNHPLAMAVFYNKMQLDFENGGAIPVTTGGSIICMCGNSNSIKSIKIYKITH